MRNLHLGKQLVLVIVFFLCCIDLWAQSSRLFLQQLGGANVSFPKSVFFKIYQDSKGFIWLGGLDGLVRYDGVNAIVYRNDRNNPWSIGDNKISDIKEDRIGNLWITTQNGVYKLDVKTERFYRFQLIDKLSGAPKEFELSQFRLLPDSDGTVWVGTLEELYCLREGDTYFRHCSTLNTNSNSSVLPNTIFDLFEDSHKALWIFAEKGIFRKNNGQGVFETIPGIIDLDKGNIDIRNYINFAESDDGRIWAMVGNKLYFYEEANGSFINFPLIFEHKRIENVIDQIEKSYDGKFWLIIGAKLYKLDLQTGNIRKARLQEKGVVASSNDRVFKIMEDRSGVLWVSSGDAAAIGRYTSRPTFQSFQTKPLENILNIPSLYSFWEIHPGELVVPRIDGLAILEWRTGKWKEFPFRPQHHLAQWGRGITCFYQAPDNKVWMGTGGGGIFILDLETGNFEHLESREEETHTLSGNRIRAIKGDQDGNIWVLTWANGISRYNFKSNQFTRYKNIPGDSTSLSSNFVRTMHEDRAGNLWFGTRGGLNKMLKNTEVFVVYKRSDEDPHSISENTAFSIHEDQQGNLWIGTFGGGLNKMNVKKGIFHAYTTNDGLLNNTVWGILPDDQGHLWLSTNEGLSRFNMEEETFRNFTQADGLINPEYNAFSFYRSPYTGEHFFSGVDGLDVFHPDSIDIDSIVPPIVFTDFKIFDKSVPISQDEEKSANQGSFFIPQHISETQSLEIPYKAKMISISFAAMHFLSPQKNKYAYQMEGFDENWRYVGNETQATYTNLDPGTYNFRVKASNADGIWNEEGTSLRIVIHPPWWQTWWAYACYLLVLVILFSIYLRYQRRRWLLNLRLAMQEQETQRLQELDKIKTQLYTNITHEFRTPLTVIEGLSGDLPSYYQQGYTNRFHKAIGGIKRNTKKLLLLINQMLDLSKLEAGLMSLQMVQGDIMIYLKYLTDCFRPLAEQRNIELQFYSEVAVLKMDFDEEKLYSILSNLLSNAIKFTGAGGKIQVKAGISKGEPEIFFLSVEDTGVGIPAAKLPYIFDRFYQVDETGYSNEGGTGIGLALVKELVELHQGKIILDSQEGKGSLFQLFLPISQNAIDKNESTKVSIGEHVILWTNTSPYSDHREAERSSTKLPTLLIVEDSPDIIEYLQISLSDAYQIQVANNGQSGIDKAQEIIPDIIISDVMMPGKDGYELCETLKSDEITSHIPIILLTAKVELEDRILGLKRGADAYLYKPFRKEELLVRLEKLTELRKTLQQRYSNFAFEETKGDHRLKIEDEFVQKIIKLIEDNLEDEQFGGKEISELIFLSRTQLYRKLKALTGKSTGHFIRSIRLRKAKKMLLETNKPIKEIAYGVGYKDPAYFSRVFVEEFGESPSRLRK